VGRAVLYPYTFIEDSKEAKLNSAKEGLVAFSGLK
jgi:hypothetical protein